MRPPGGLVLRHQQAVERLGQRRADRLELAALDPKRRALAEVDDSGELGARRRRGGGGRQPARQLRLQARRQVAEQGEVRRHPIALGRIMGAPQLLQPAVVPRAEQRR